MSRPIDFRYRHVATHRAGSYGYAQPRARGTVWVDDDADGPRRYVYSVSRGELREFRQWVAQTWNNGESKVSGA